MQLSIQDGHLLSCKTEMARALIIPPDVTTIGNEACRDCIALRRVVISGNVRVIEPYAFQGCAHLVHLVFEEGVEQIGEGAFYGCTSLEEVTLPASLKKMGRRIFEGCENLKKVTFGPNLTSLGQFCFSRCPSLESVVVPPEALNMGKFLPWYSQFKKLEEIVVPEGIEYLDHCAFQGCNMLKKVTLPSTLKEIGQYTFECCYALQELVLPENLLSMHPQAIQSCPSLQRLTMPRQIFLSLHLVEENTVLPSTRVVTLSKAKIKKQTSSDPFHDCSSLRKVHLYRDEVAIAEAKRAKEERIQAGYWEDDTFEYQDTERGTVLVRCKKKIIASATIQPVISILPDAFRSGVRIQELTIEDGLEELDFELFKDLKVLQLHLPATLVRFLHLDTVISLLRRTELNDSYGPKGYYLPTISIDENNPVYRVEHNCLIRIDEQGRKILLRYLSGDNSTSVTLQEGIYAVESYAFNQDAITSLTMPQSLRIVGSKAIQHCSQITNLIFQEGIEVLPDQFFDDCYNLDSLELPSTLQSIGGLKVPYYYFYAHKITVLCEKGSLAEKWAKTNQHCHIRYKSSPNPSGGAKFRLKVINDIKYVISYSGDLPELDIDKGLKDAGTYGWQNAVFQNHRELRKIIFPKGMTYLPQKICADCSNLSEVTLPDTIRTIDSFAFDSCFSLLSLYIPPSVEKISAYAFGPIQHYVDWKRKLTIHGKMGSAAERFAKQYQLRFVADVETEEAAALSRQFSWYIHHDDTIHLTGVTQPDATDDLVIPDEVSGKKVVAIDFPGSPGRRRLIIGKNLEALSCNLDLVTGIILHPDQKFILEDDGDIYDQKGTRLIWLSPAHMSAASYHIQAGTKYIREGLFKNCKNLKELHIPRSMVNQFPAAFRLHSTFEDPMIVYGPPSSVAPKLAVEYNALYIDPNMSQEDQENIITFRLVQMTYQLTGGGSTKKGYTSHGCTVSSGVARLPETVGGVPVVTLASWKNSNVPDTLYIPSHVSYILNSPILARKQVIVSPDNLYFKSAGGQLYDEFDRLYFCPSECPPEPALEGVRILCDGSYSKRHLDRLVISTPLVTLGDIVQEGHLNTLEVRARVGKVVLTPGTVDTVCFPEQLCANARLFYHVRWISILDTTDSEKCRLYGRALEHAHDLSKNTLRLLEGHTLREMEQGTVILDLPWLIRRHDEAFDEMKSQEDKLRMCLARLLTPVELSEEMEGRYRYYLSHAMKRCIEMLCKDEDVLMLQSICRAGFVNRRNVRRLVEVTTGLGKTEWTAMLLKYAMQP
ncbi:MAG: leucine-rich repeat protein [Clostridia bacterium]|nr:leucine-rich repeat protein [Clostridia bacterium]